MGNKLQIKKSFELFLILLHFDRQWFPFLPTTTVPNGIFLSKHPATPACITMSGRFICNCFKRRYVVAVSPIPVISISMF